jgi:hypothetical protein
MADLLAGVPRWRMLELAARRLMREAVNGDIQAIKEVADRLDGRVQGTPTEHGVSVSFVVRMPDVATVSDWAREVRPMIEREHDALPPLTPQALARMDAQTNPRTRTKPTAIEQAHANAQAQDEGSNQLTGEKPTFSHPARVGAASAGPLSRQGQHAVPNRELAPG